MKDKGCYKEIPTDEYPAHRTGRCDPELVEEQGVAQQFLSYFKSAAVAELLVGYGFDVSSRTNK
jgi:hypothetical protein